MNGNRLTECGFRSDSVSFSYIHFKICATRMIAMIARAKLHNLSACTHISVLIQSERIIDSPKPIVYRVCMSDPAGPRSFSGATTCTAKRNLYGFWNDASMASDCKEFVTPYSYFLFGLFEWLVNIRSKLLLLNSNLADFHDKSLT